MPITIPNGLPAKSILEQEKIFAIEDESAGRQDIRPLKIVLVNLMPKKIETETQILRLISKSPLQVQIDFMKIENHISKNTSEEHLVTFYKTFQELKENFYDGMIITGAPVEHLPFEEVDYWDELREIMEWSKTHVFSTVHICWGAQAGLYYHYGIGKYMLDDKVFGIFPQVLQDEYDFLTNGFDEIHNTPHSRHTQIEEDKLAKESRLNVLSKSEETGSNIIVSKDYRHIFIIGHFEYGVETLGQEYERDVAAKKKIHIPFNYYPENDTNKTSYFTWRSHANLLYRNWLNYVYQMTPFDITKIQEVPMGESKKENNGYAKAFNK